MKRDYIIVPEPHIFDKNLANRIDYQKEVRDILGGTLIDLIKQRKEVSDQVFVVFAGDIFHNGISDSDTLLYWYNYFINLRGICTDIFSVVGNHEISYLKKNLFWKLVSEVESPYINAYKKKPLVAGGEFPVIRIVDELVDGNVSIHMGHYERYPLATNKTNILVTHNNLISAEIAELLLTKYGRDQSMQYIQTRGSSVLNEASQFDYVFIGHLHRAYSKFESKKNNGEVSVWRYLGSIGRTNTTEVNDSDLERVLPVVSTYCGELVEVTEYKFNLSGRSESVNEIAVDKSKAVYELKKDKKEATRHMVRTGNPVYDVMAMLTDRPLAGLIFKTSLKCNISDSVDEFSDGDLSDIDFEYEVEEEEDYDEDAV